jgi:excisionase family DNA binding protein
MNRSDPEETYLTVAEVAQTLKLNQQTVRNWIDQGSLPALRVGRRVRIKRSDFERILEESYSGGTASPSRVPGPSADDFWGGEPVGLAEAPAVLAVEAPARANGQSSGAGSDGQLAGEDLAGENRAAEDRAGEDRAGKGGLR